MKTFLWFLEAFCSMFFCGLLIVMLSIFIRLTRIFKTLLGKFPICHFKVQLFPPAVPGDTKQRRANGNLKNVNFQSNEIIQSDCELVVVHTKLHYAECDNWSASLHHQQLNEER